MKRKTITMLVAAGMSCFALGAAAASVAQNVTAQIRTDFKVIYNDSTCSLTDATGKAIYPLVYEGTTYLPVRSIGQILDLDVDWNGESKTVILSQAQKNDDDDNDDDTTVTKPQENTPSTPSSSEKLTDVILSDAVIQNLAAQVDALEASIKSLTYSSVESENFARYSDYHGQIERLSSECDRLEDICEGKQREGSISTATYRTYDQALDKIDAQLDDLDDLLEHRLRYDD